MSLKTKFPKADGWITAKLTLNRGCTMTEEDAKQYIEFFSDPDSPPEIGHIDVSRNPVVIIYRERKAAALVEEHGTASLKSEN